MENISLFNALENLETEYRLTPCQRKRCSEFFSTVNPGDIIYPGALKKKLSLGLIKIYFLLEYLKKQGFLQCMYEVYCMGCGHSKGIFLDSLADFNDGNTCDLCGKSLSVTEDLIVLYKVLHL